MAERGIADPHEAAVLPRVVRHHPTQHRVHDLRHLALPRFQHVPTGVEGQRDRAVPKQPLTVYTFLE